jgi:hypothetical protein
VGGGWGVKPTMGIMNFNLRRSQVKKMGKSYECEFFSFRSENIFLFPLFNSVEKKPILRRKSIGGASVSPPHVPYQVTPLLESILIYS